MLLMALIIVAPSFAIASQKKVISIEALVANGQYDAARQVLNLATRNDPERQLLLNHLEGLIHLQKGDLDSAIAKFRENLAANPNFFQSRNYLAQALFAKGDMQGFSYHANRVISGPISENLRDAYVRKLAKISHGKPWGIQTRFSLLPSTNINKGSSHEGFVLNGREFTINDNSKLKSGIGFSAGVTGFVKKQLTERSSLALILDVDGQKYSETVLNDAFTLQGKFAYTQNFERGSFSIGPQIKQQWDAWEPSRLSYGVFTKVSHQLTNKINLFLSADYWQHDYEDNEIFDGYSYNVATTLSYQHNPHLGFSLTASAYRDVKEDLKHLSYLDMTLRAGIIKEWKGGAITAFFGSYGQRVFDENFTLHNYEREDDHYSVGFKLKHRKLTFKGVVPELSYEYTKQKSNVLFYDYDSHDVSLSLSKAF
jgi:tetratricopeptide (TPR) repeat protein